MVNAFSLKSHLIIDEKQTCFIIKINDKRIRFFGLSKQNKMQLIELCTNKQNNRDKSVLHLSETLQYQNDLQHFVFLELMITILPFTISQWKCRP